MSVGSLLAGLLLGVAGSLHCVGMCGPLVLMMPFGRLEALIYHLGRTFTYVLMGFLAGFMFQVIDIRIYQREFSVGIGIVFFLMWAYQQWGNVLARVWKVDKVNQSRDSIKKGVLGLYSQALRRKHLAWRAVAGFANGLLPCGLVYGALMAGVGQGSTLGSTMLMLGFGLGTIPSLFLLAMIGNKIETSVRRYWTKLLPWWLLIMSIIFILRGLNLGIPFVSPHIILNPEGHRCCVLK